MRGYRLRPIRFLDCDTVIGRCEFPSGLIFRFCHRLGYVFPSVSGKEVELRSRLDSLTTVH